MVGGSIHSDQCSSRLKSSAGYSIHAAPLDALGLFQAKPVRFGDCQSRLVPRLIEPDQVMHPSKHRNVSDSIVIVHDPPPTGKSRFHDAKQALNLLT